MPDGPSADTIRRNYPLLLKRMERLMEVSRQLGSTLDLGLLLRQIITAAHELTGTEAASIMLFDPNTGKLHFEATTNESEKTLAGIEIPVEGSIAGWIVTHREPLVVPDVNQDDRWNPAVDDQTAFVTRSILGAPLVARDKVIGALEAINKTRGTFTAEDIETLQTLAAQAAVAITNARLFQQSDLISEMVHELRTPLASVTASSHLLLRPELPEPKRQEIIRTIQQETARLSQMTTDFLDMARLDSGRVRFTFEACDLGQLVDECVEQIRPQAAGRRLHVETRVTPGLPTAHTDRGKLKQVLLNLLTNAVKYNREHGRILVSAEPVDGQVRVQVTDTGKGIPPEAMPNMFQKFYRVPDSEGYASGTGLGLPIAKKIVEALDGEMGVTSTVDVGSTFYFILPLRHPRAHAGA